MGNLSDDKDINRTWVNIKENIKTSAKECLGLHELKQYKLWFDDECLGFLGQMKWAKMQRKGEASRHFRNKKKAYLKTKIEELETNSKIKNIRDLCRGFNDFKKA